MAATTKQRAARKKKRISKHVLASKNKTPQGEDQGANGLDLLPPVVNNNNNNNTKTKKRERTNKKRVITKDPLEAALYLSSWKKQRHPNNNNNGNNGPEWKFNKNTQSWLVRHMYEPDKVPKSVFDLLLEYLGGLTGQTTKQRVWQDAKRRAKRYKEYEKTTTTTTTNAATTNKETNQETAPTTTITTNDNNNDDDDSPSSSMWEKLDAHGKRKEYKRARKILDLLKTTTDTTTTSNSV